MLSTWHLACRRHEINAWMMKSVFINYWIIQSLIVFIVSTCVFLSYYNKSIDIIFLKSTFHSITVQNLKSQYKITIPSKKIKRKYTYFLRNSILPKNFPLRVFIVLRGQFCANCWRFRQNFIFLGFLLAVLTLPLCSTQSFLWKMTVKSLGTHFHWKPPFWYMPKLCINTPAEGLCTALSKLELTYSVRIGLQPDNNDDAKQNTEAIEIYCHSLPHHFSSLAHIPSFPSQ